ncbi:MAG: DNA methyltransferase [bacterium]
MLYERLILIRDLMHGEATIYVHMGWAVSHYVRGALDEVFGNSRAVNQIVWKRQTAHSDSGQGSEHLGRLHDILFLYTKSDRHSWNVQYAPYDPEHLETHYQKTDPETGRRYELDNLIGPGGAAKGNPSYEFLGVTRFWRYSRERMEQLYQQGRIVQPSEGAVPRYKRYLDEMPGVPVQDIWDDLNAINSQAKESAGYAPEARGLAGASYQVQQQRRRSRRRFLLRKRDDGGRCRKAWAQVDRHRPR